MLLHKELISPCWVCGKRWKREDLNEYLFFQGIVVCRSHKGAEQWYNGAIKLACERMEICKEKKEVNHISEKLFKI